ncbi:MAG: hypothetical protein BGO78_13035 [Chloroflexi bacterium 44-23]|nr:MAG: hypothetical protein BGO78_13035 [Chloroflexi bacterium 44-23]
MNAIISLLPLPFADRVKDTWQELETRFGLIGIQRAPYPHFSWQGAERYEQQGLLLTLQTIANMIEPFAIQTGGVRYFAGEMPVVFIEVIKTPQLARLHQQIWNATRPLSTTFNPYYAPQQWQPHITLAMGDLPMEMLPKVLAWLQPQEFSWQIDIEQFSYYQESNNQAGQLTHHFAFKHQI